MGFFYLFLWDPDGVIWPGYWQPSREGCLDMLRLTKVHYPRVTGFIVRVAVWKQLPGAIA